MASNVALTAVAGLDCYIAAKGGSAAITRSMAVDFAPQEVQVNAVAPAATMTDRVRCRFEAGNPRVTKIAAAYLIGFIEPNDIANIAVFLASDESPPVTGPIQWIAGSRFPDAGRPTSADQAINLILRKVHCAAHCAAALIE
jgi:NAD(P)-dependent dehydrogenase (short-subunit alcohol dehydrogenase family)